MAARLVPDTTFRQNHREDDGEDVLDDTPDSEAVEGIELDLRTPFTTIADGKRVLNHEITHGGSWAGEEPA